MFCLFCLMAAGSQEVARIEDSVEVVECQMVMILVLHVEKF